MCRREDNASEGSSGDAASVGHPGSFFLLKLHRKNLNDDPALGNNLLFLKEMTQANTEPRFNKVELAAVYVSGISPEPLWSDLASSLAGRTWLPLVWPDV